MSMTLPFPYKTEPYAHQRKLVEEKWADENYALFLEMGLGKSKICIDQVALQYEAGDIDMVIVVAKNGVYTNWPNHEFPRHLHDDIYAHTYVWGGLKTKREQEEFDAWLNINDGSLKIMALSFDAIKIERCQELINRAVKVCPRYTLILDESSVIKKHTTAVCKAALKLSRLARYRRILTGTPACEGPMDLWGQLLALFPRPMGFSNFYSFKSTYAIEKDLVLGNRTVKKIVGYRNLDDLTQRMAPFTTSLLKEECLDLPPKMFEVVHVPFTPRQERAYNEMKAIAMTEIGGELITGVNALAMMVKLHQITCGQMKTENGYLELPTNKIEAAENLVAESASKVIVWSHFVGTQNALYDALNPLHGAVHISSEDSTKVRDAKIADWRNDPTIKVLIANQASLGHGVTLTEASTVIYYSNGFSLEQRLQSEDRAHRIGQTRPVNYYDLAIDKTIDTHVISALRSKRSLASEITGAENLKEVVKGLLS